MAAVGRPTNERPSLANDAIRLEQNDFTVTPKRCEAEAIRTTPVTVELINGGAVKNQFFLLLDVWNAKENRVVYSVEL